MQSVAVAQMGDTAIGSGAVVPVADRDLVEKLLVHAADHLALVGANRYRTRWHLSRHVSLSVDVRIHGAAVLGGVLGYTVTPPLLSSYLLRGIGEEIGRGLHLGGWGDRPRDLLVVAVPGVRNVVVGLRASIGCFGSLFIQLLLTFSRPLVGPVAHQGLAGPGAATVDTFHEGRGCDLLRRCRRCRRRHWF